MDDSNPYLSPHAITSASAVGARAGARDDDAAGTIRFAGRLPLGDLMRGSLLKTGPVLSTVLAGILLIGIAILIFVAINAPPDDHSVLIVVTSPVVVVLLLYCGRILSQRYRGAGPFQLHETELSLDGVRQLTDAAKVELKWEFFRRQRTSNRVGILPLKNSRQFLILSRALLERDEDWPRVQQLLERCLPS